VLTPEAVEAAAEAATATLVAVATVVVAAWVAAAVTQGGTADNGTMGRVVGICVMGAAGGARQGQTAMAIAMGVASSGHEAVRCCIGAEGGVANGTVHSRCRPQTCIVRRSLTSALLLLFGAVCSLCHYPMLKLQPCSQNVANSLVLML
jgi:hypothetical protein